MADFAALKPSRLIGSPARRRKREGGGLVPDAQSHDCLPFDGMLVSGLDPPRPHHAEACRRDQPARLGFSDDSVVCYVPQRSVPLAPEDERLASTKLRRRWIRFAGGRGLARVLRGTLYVKLGLAPRSRLASSGSYLRLVAGPLSFGRLPERVAGPLAARIGPGWSVALRDTALQLERRLARPPGDRARHPQSGRRAGHARALRDRQRRRAVAADREPCSRARSSSGTCRCGPRSTATARCRSCHAQDAWPAEGDRAALPPPQPAGAPTRAAAEHRPFAGLGCRRLAVRAVVGPSGISARSTCPGDECRLSARRCRTARARDLRPGRRRLRADRDRRPALRRHPRRPAGRLAAQRRCQAPTAAAATRERWSLQMRPVQDLLLLSGLSAIPATTDLEAVRQGSTRASPEGRVDRAARPASSASAGTIQIDDKDTSPLPVETAARSTRHGTRARRALLLTALELKGGDTHVRLQGELSALPGEPGWRAVRGPGRDPEPARPPATGRCGSTTIEARLSAATAASRSSPCALRGPTLSADLTGSLAHAADPRGTQARRAARTGRACAPPCGSGRKRRRRRSGASSWRTSRAGWSSASPSGSP